MKRFLSWLVLIAGLIVYVIIAALSIRFLYYLIGLYQQVTPFLKLVIIILGGSFFCGIAFTPIIWGVALAYSWSERVCESRKGARYIVLGIFVIITSLFGVIIAFNLADILYLLFGIALIAVTVKSKRGQSE